MYDCPTWSTQRRNSRLLMGARSRASTSNRFVVGPALSPRCRWRVSAPRAELQWLPILGGTPRPPWTRCRSLGIKDPMRTAVRAALDQRGPTPIDEGDVETA